jgi:hypothetical protein
MHFSPTLLAHQQAESVTPTSQEITLVGVGGAAAEARRAEVEQCRRGAAGWGSVFDRRAGQISVFEAVVVASEGEDLGGVDEQVDHCGGGDFVARDLASGAERLSGRDDQAGAFVAARRARTSGSRLAERTGATSRLHGPELPPCMRPSLSGSGRRSKAGGAEPHAKAAGEHVGMTTMIGPLSRATRVAPSVAG